jgi:hypothetical protein
MHPFADYGGITINAIYRYSRLRQPAVLGKGLSPWTEINRCLVRCGADSIKSFMVSAIACPKTSKSFIYVYIERLVELQQLLLRICRIAKNS